MKKIMHIVGARPQFIKLAPLVHKSEHVFVSSILHTGQHYDKAMSDSFFADLDIPEPDYNLGVSSSLQGKQTALMLEGIEAVLNTQKPDAVVVYGDTNSTLAGALAAAKLGIYIVHIEACLRSFNRSMPEEINRICTDHISNLLFAPTQTAIDNALKEGLSDKTCLVGDVMTDSLAYGMAKAKKQSSIMDKLSVRAEEYYLLTLHRPYTVDNPSILIDLLAKLNGLGSQVIFPVHPRTAAVLNRNEVQGLNNIRMIEPQSYLDFISLMSNSKMILTDSGGIQKEAYILKKPCITLRSETEWLETVESGWNLLLKPSTHNMHKIVTGFKVPAIHPDLFGTDVSDKIVNILKERLSD